MIRAIQRWTRARFIAFSAVVGLAAFFLSVGVTDAARRARNAERTRHELVLAATTAAPGAIAIYDTRMDKGLVALDALAARERRRQLLFALALGAVVVAWAGVARAWLGRHRAAREPSTPR